MFISFLFEPSFGMVDLIENTVHALGSWETAVTVTTPEDIGILTPEILFAEPRIVNRSCTRPETPSPIPNWSTSWT